MNAEVVYQVAKAIPKEEKKRLFEILQKEHRINSLQITKMKKPVLTKEEAIQYLLKNIFNKTSF
ncbi:hypothetical protein [Tenacibaculum ovolyticum]|uniref:hypothetical protein n=1 Tax=Tenacibaculum ovolyticum TaxID=104270 RepID=UPI003BA8664D